jgi:hypothetical protein
VRVWRGTLGCISKHDLASVHARHASGMECRNASARQGYSQGEPGLRPLMNEGEDKGRRMGSGEIQEMGLTCVTAVWVSVRSGQGGCVSVRATAPAHALFCRRRWLNSNRISTIANRAFAGLTALRDLCDAGLWVLLTFLVGA